MSPVKQQKCPTPDDTSIRFSGQCRNHRDVFHRHTGSLLFIARMQVFYMLIAAPAGRRTGSIRTESMV